ncbi:Uncharacterized protein JA1_005437 [Spathaspora sp. JA1]|nr:Uncharacterized protein JA1_005437 [Spathaspora sp. JA1]
MFDKRTSPVPVPAIFKSRQAIRLGRLILVVLLVINVLYFSLFKQTTPIQINIDPRQQYNQQISKLFGKIFQDPNRYHMASTGLTQVDIKVPIKKFMFQYQQDQDSWTNQDVLYYDPRFTISMYLNEIHRRYVKLSGTTKKKQKVDANKLEPISLPFNWVDWMDMSILNQDLSKPLAERINCLDIRKVTNNDPDTAYFCINNQDLPPAKFNKLPYKNKSQLPGFVIHDHSTHDDRPLNDYRILEGRSYAMTHMPNPLKVIILNGDQGTFEFDVNNNSRLAGNEMVDNFVTDNNLEVDMTTVNHLNVLRKLQDKVVPLKLSSSDSRYTIHQSLTTPSTLKLNERMFAHPPSIDTQLQNIGKVGLTRSLTDQEQSYYNSLIECKQYTNENEPRYFRMAVIRMDDPKNRDQEWGWHYDWRFFNGALNYDREGWTVEELGHRTNIILDRLLRNWNRFAQQKGIISWIMHGPLLSWYWDGLMFPFDVDIDIQMPMSDLLYLAKNYNNTLIVEDPSEGYGKYLIDVNPYMHNRGISEGSNHIDARFIDVDSGIYIDITALSKSNANPPDEYNEQKLVDLHHKNKNQIYNDRRKHFYSLDQLSPLRTSMLQGVPVFIPSTITPRLMFEYQEGLNWFEFNGWYFVNKLNLWIKQDKLAAIYDIREISNDDNISIDKSKLLDRVKNMSDEEVYQLLQLHDDILVEYYLTKNLTDLHAQESMYLFDETGRDNIREVMLPRDVTDQFVMHRPMRKALYDYENIERVKYHTNN